MSYRTHPPGVEVETNKLSYKEPVVVVSTSPVALTGTVASISIDGVTSFSNGDRIMLAGQGGDTVTADIDNGIYVYTDDTTNYTLTRAEDFNEDVEVRTGVFALVNTGTAEANTGWKVNTTTAITPGTDPFTWLKVISAGGAIGEEELVTGIDYNDNNPAIPGWIGGTTLKSTAIDQLNETLGRLIPTQPDNFPSAQFTIQSTTNYLKASGGAAPLNGNTGVADGTSIATRLASSFTSNTLTDNGPGDTGTLTGDLNGSAAGTVTITGSTSDTEDGVVDFSNNDGFPATGSGANFWDSFDVRLESRAGFLASSGYNQASITHSGAGTATSNVWMYDAVATTPTVVSFTHSSSSVSTSSSSSVPHLNNGQAISYSANIDDLAGWTYLSSNVVRVRSRGEGGTFSDSDYDAITGTQNLDPGDAGIPSIIAEQSGASAISNTISTSNVHSQGNMLIRGSSPAGNSSESTSSSPIILVMGSATTSRVDEDNIEINSLGTGSGNSSRVQMTGDSQTDTPNVSYTSASANWNGTTALPDYQAAVVGGVLNHNTVDYSSGYYPVGPNLNVAGRSGSQYITFLIQRSTVSKFDIRFSGEVAGCWVKLVGVSDSTVGPDAYWDGVSTDNGWWDMTSAYAGAGVPGTGTDGNGNTGCSLSGAIPANTTVNNQSYTCTFGPESSSFATNNNILVRFRLDSGDKITDLSFRTASN